MKNITLLGTMKQSSPIHICKLSDRKKFMNGGDWRQYFSYRIFEKKPDSQKINPYFTYVIKKLSGKLVIPIETSTNHERSHPLAKKSHAPRHNI